MKIIFVLLILFACIFCLISFLTPIPYSNSCGEDNVHRYRMGIYRIDTNIIKKKELKKLGGLLCFAGIQHIRCPHEMAIQWDKMLAQAIDCTNRSLTWRFLKNDLWINKNGDIGLKEKIAIGNEGVTFVDSYLASDL